MESNNGGGGMGDNDVGGGWGPMGGSEGDGNLLITNSPPYASKPPVPPPLQPPPAPPDLSNSGLYGQQPPQQPPMALMSQPLPPQQQSQPMYMPQPAASFPGGGNTDGSYGGGGSITRFAPPQPPQVFPAPSMPSSYAARSQQLLGSSYPPPPTPSHPTNAAVASSSSFAARSQMAYSQQSQAPYGAAGNAAMMYPNVPPNVPASHPQQVSPTLSGMPPPQQQPPQPQPGQTPVGSYAARSQQQQQQQMYAARSAQALYGTPPPQQQQQQPFPPPQQPQPHPHGSGPPPQQQPSYYQLPTQQQQVHQQPPYGPPQPGMTPMHPVGGIVRIQETPQALALQQHLLTEATRKVQEHAYYMRQAMEQQNLPVVLDRAAHMVGELGGPPHGQSNQSTLPPPTSTNPGAPPPPGNPNQPANTGGSARLTPKNYYELYMRALEEMPALEDYLLNLAASNNPNNPEAVPSDHIRIVDTTSAVPPVVAPKAYTMRELYDCVQYCPRVVSRLYLQIAAGSALLRSGEAGPKFVLRDLQDVVKCEQNPIRGLFLRHYLLTALKDKLPTAPVPPGQESTSDPSGVATGGGAGSEAVNRMSDATANPESEAGNVRDSYEFVLANFMEMNKLWVRIQHLPGEGRNKDVRKRRERERNDLRILVGTNLVRLSQLESVTSQIYGEVILPRILEHIVVAGDPLSQAYLMDCLVQVFPDEYHIETLPILLNVCPRLRDKVNIRTILQGLMDRLANYLADEELLDESDTNEVKKTLARDSFGMFEECVQAVYNARGPKLTSREVIRLQTALLQFSIKCYPGNMEQVSRCIHACVSALRQANASYEFYDGTVVELPPEKIPLKALDDVAVVELEKLLSIPLDTLALKVLQLHDYSALIGFLPWVHRREVAIHMLQAAVETTESVPTRVREVEELFRVIEPLIRDEYPKMSNPSYPYPNMAGLQVSPPAQPMSYPNTSHPGTTTADASCPYTPDQLHKIRQENALVSKLVHLLSKNKDSNVVFDMLVVARTQITGAGGGPYRIGQTLVAIVFASLRLCHRIFNNEHRTAKKTPSQPEAEVKVDSQAQNRESTEQVESPEKATEVSKAGADSVSDTDPDKKTESATSAALGLLTQKTGDEDLFADTTVQNNIVADSAKPVIEPEPVPDVEPITCRQVFVFIQETVAEIAKHQPETGLKLYLDASLAADSFASVSEQEDNSADYAAIAFEFLTQAFTTFEERVFDPKMQYRCLVSFTGTLMVSKSLSKENYENLITKTAQWSAKVTKKQDQCQLVALCAHLFYPVGSTGLSSEAMKYSNPQRALECLQRCLKLADACTTTNPAHVRLFVDTLEHYVFFFEKKNPVVTHAYISGLVALIKEHLSSLGGSVSLTEAKTHFLEVIRYINKKKKETDSSQLFAPVNLG